MSDRKPVLAIVGVVAALLVAGAPQAEPQPAGVRWMPAQVGTHKVFVHRTDRTLSSAGTELGSERFIGTREERVLAAPAGFAGATAELRVTTHTRSAESGEEREEQQFFVSPTPSAYQVHAARMQANGQTYLVRYPRPAQLLEEGAEPGRKWHVSTEDVAGLRGETWGEVVGLQDARTPAGLFENCLVVRYTAAMSGRVEVAGAGPMDVVDGKVVATEWHARGVGLVLSKEVLEEKLLAPNGVEISVVVESQSALRELTQAPAAARLAH